ncbi:uncharacterized protein LOC141491945 isoform X2 [Macrotis lagotis]|uniref:uncharacterized protein LOC141491945 isoform X2 n=1 Tax=Macrotis lagotis TaxID=92651 RepID=UPI003D68286F
MKFCVKVTPLGIEVRKLTKQSKMHRSCHPVYNCCDNVFNQKSWERAYRDHRRKGVLMPRLRRLRIPRQGHSTEFFSDPHAGCPGLLNPQGSTEPPRSINQGVLMPRLRRLKIPRQGLSSEFFSTPHAGCPGLLNPPGSTEHPRSINQVETAKAIVDCGPPLIHNHIQLNLKKFKVFVRQMRISVLPKATQLEGDR